MVKNWSDMSQAGAQPDVYWSPPSAHPVHDQRKASPLQDHTDDIVGDEFDRLFAAAEAKRGTAGRLEQLSAVHQLLINDYTVNFLPFAISATGKPLSQNSQESYRSGIVSALLKLRRGEKLTSDENSYTRMFKRYVGLLKEFNVDTDDVLDDDELDD